MWLFLPSTRQRTSRSIQMVIWNSDQLSYPNSWPTVSPLSFLKQTRYLMRSSTILSIVTTKRHIKPRPIFWRKLQVSLKSFVCLIRPKIWWLLYQMTRGLIRLLRMRASFKSTCKFIMSLKSAFTINTSDSVMIFNRHPLPSKTFVNVPRPSKWWTSCTQTSFLSALLHSLIFMIS